MRADVEGRNELGVASRKGAPPEVVSYAGWDTLYAEAADGLDVLGDVDAAVAWANDFIRRATEATPSQ